LKKLVGSSGKTIIGWRDEGKSVWFQGDREDEYGFKGPRSREGTWGPFNSIGLTIPEYRKVKNQFKSEKAKKGGGGFKVC